MEEAAGRDKEYVSHVTYMRRSYIYTHDHIEIYLII